SGRVIYSANATDEISETISRGMGFSLGKRKEVALKNALMKLGQQFQKGIQYTRSDLQVSSGGSDTITIQDTGERLTTGMKIHVYNREKVAQRQDRKSTRLNSSHVKISYAVFCLKKKIIQ